MHQRNVIPWNSLTFSFFFYKMSFFSRQFNILFQGTRSHACLVRYAKRGGEGGKEKTASSGAGANWVVFFCDHPVSGRAHDLNCSEQKRRRGETKRLRRHPAASSPLAMKICVAGNTTRADLCWNIHLKINTKTKKKTTFQDEDRKRNSLRDLKASSGGSEECEDRPDATGEEYKEGDWRERQQSERPVRAEMLPSLFSPQLVALVISQLCFFLFVFFVLRIWMLTHS